MQKAEMTFFASNDDGTATADLVDVTIADADLTSKAGVAFAFTVTNQKNGKTVCFTLNRVDSSYMASILSGVINSTPPS